MSRLNPHNPLTVPADTRVVMRCSAGTSPNAKKHGSSRHAGQAWTGAKQHLARAR
jgi:hypothetical protein